MKIHIPDQKTAKRTSPSKQREQIHTGLKEIGKPLNQPFFQADYLVSKLSNSCVMNISRMTLNKANERRMKKVGSGRMHEPDHDSAPFRTSWTQSKPLTDSRASPRLQARLLKLAKASGPEQAQQMLIQLQCQYGNRCVQRVVQRARESEETKDRLKSSSGSKLDESMAAVLGKHFNTDLSNVQIHTDVAAADVCADFDAKAIASGSHIYFGAGKYNPGSDSGHKLIGHEVAHIVQQSTGRTSGLSAKAEADGRDSRYLLEADADTHGEAVTKKLATSEQVDWKAVDRPALAAYLEHLTEKGQEVPVADEPKQLESHPLMQRLAKRFEHAAPAREPGGNTPVQLDKDENWYGLGSPYNMVKVEGIPSKFIEHGNGSTARYNFFEHGHLDWSTKGANSRRDSNFGIEIKGSGGTKTYHYDDAKKPEWSRVIQGVVGGAANDAADKKTVSMHNWAFSNIEASDWFNVVPAVLAVEPQEVYQVHGVDEKIAFSIPAGGNLEVGYSQIVSRTSGVTASQELGQSTTRSREITFGLSSKLEKKDVYKVGGSFGLSSANVSKVWDRISSSVSKVTATSGKVSTIVPFTAPADRGITIYVYPVWNVTPIRVQAYPHDDEAKVTGEPRWFTISHMELLEVKDMPVDAEGNFVPDAPNDPGLVAEERRLEELKAGRAIKVGGQWASIAMVSERRLLKDYDHQYNKAIYEAESHIWEQEWDSSVTNSFTQSDANGQEVASTGKWNLGAGGEYKGPGIKFGYGEAKTTAANYGDTVAKSGSTGKGRGLSIKVSIPGSKNPKTYIQVSLIPMYTERVYRYAIYNFKTDKWGPWLKEHTRSREYEPMPAMERIERPEGTDMAPLGPGKLKPSPAQKKSAKTVKELRELRDKETDPAKRREIAEQIEAQLLSVRSDHEEMVRRLHPTLTPIDRPKNLYKITVANREYFGTLEVLADFTAPSTATLKAGERLYSEGTKTSGGASIEVAGGLGGTGAQGRANPFPGDVDLSENIKVTAKSADAAAQALADMVRKTVRDATKPTETGEPPMQFLGMTCGTYPLDATKAGKLANWTHGQVLAGRQTYKMKGGSGTGTFTLAEAFASPHPERVVNTFWRGPIDTKGTFGEITKVIAYEAIGADTGEKLFATKKIGQGYQEVSFEKPALHDTERMALMDQLAPQIAAYAKAGNWLKAIKRAFTVARMGGDFEALNDFTPLLGGTLAELKTVTEHTELFMDEVVNHRKLKPKARPDVKETVSREAALEMAKQFSLRISLLDASIGRQMDAAIDKAGSDIRRNRLAYRHMKDKVVTPLKHKISADKDYAKQAKRTLIFHGYLKK